MELNLQVLKIIEKHIGSKIFAIFKDEKGVKMIVGKLQNANAEKILISDMNSTAGNQVIPYVENGRPKMLAMYNSNALNIMNPTNNEHLGAKLRKRENQMKIINSMKPFLKKNISVVYKNNGNIVAVNGQLGNMGMVNLTILPAPFFNDEQIMKYNDIMNIFDEFGNDLIDIK